VIAPYLFEDRLGTADRYATSFVLLELCAASGLALFAEALSHSGSPG
jgi:hypothetical protein